METEGTELTFGIQECAKCRYKVRCEECVYNEKDIAELLRQEMKATAKEILSMFDDRNYISEKDLKKAIAKRYGVEVE